MADEKLFGTIGAGGLYWVAPFSVLFYFILSHVCRVMGISIFQGKDVFFSSAMGMLCFALYVFVGGCFIEDEDRSYQDPVIS